MAFNFFGRQHRDVFASAGSNRATVYRCPPEGGLSALHVFCDSDPAEDYYVCAWSIDTATGAALLLLAGKSAVLKVINCATGTLETSLEGHGQCINDIAAHPTRPHLVATASRDQSVRLWNIRTRACVLIFQGDGGHRNEVLAVDWRRGGGTVLASAGMDSCVKIWDLAAFEDCIRASEEWTGAEGVAFPTRLVNLPTYSTRVVHFNYVDCIRWLGDFLLSKSVDNQIVCWRPDEEASERGGGTEVPSAASGATEAPAAPGGTRHRSKDCPVHSVQQLQLEDAKDVWWMRFSLDLSGQVLAAGTSQGKVLVFDPHRLQRGAVAKLRPRRLGNRNDESGGKLLVRQTTVSANGGIIVACHEDGSITRFDAEGGAVAG